MDASVGAWIAKVLGNFGPDAAPAAPALVRRLMQGGDCSATTSWALGQIGDEGIPYLGRALSSPHAKTRTWAMDALLDAGQRAAPVADAMVALLDDPETGARRDAALGVGRFPAVRKRARAKLLALTKDPEEEVRDSAASGLARDANEPEVRARLFEMVQTDPSEYVASTVLEAIDPYLGRNAQTIALLRKIEATPDPESELVWHARGMLLRRGIDDQALVERMAEAPADEPLGTALARATTLTQSGPNGRRAALPHPHQVLTWWSDAEVRVRAIESLERLGAVAAKDEATMRLLTKHADPAQEESNVAAAAAAALKALRSER